MREFVLKIDTLLILTRCVFELSDVIIYIYTPRVVNAGPSRN